MSKTDIPARKASLRTLWRSADHLNQANFFEFIIEEMIKRFCKAGDTAVDVGANYGAHTITMLQSVGPSGSVFAVEPNPRIAVTLRGWNHRNLFVLSRALSNRSGTEKFLIDRCDGLGSLRYRPHQGMIVSDEISVVVSRLDDIEDILKNSRLTLIKADIEGEEANFLLGAKETIAAANPLVLIEFDWGEVFKDNRAKAVQFLTEIRGFGRHGYMVLDFFCDPVREYDESAWNLILAPTSFDHAALTEVALNAGERFFRDHKDWNPYKKLQGII